MIFGDSFLNWLIRILLAFLTFFVVRWVLYWLAAFVKATVPDPIIPLVADSRAHRACRLPPSCEIRR